MSEAKAIQLGLALLARREHASLELKRKLMQKGIDSRDAEFACHKLKAQGLQSDERYADMWIRSRIHRGQGPMRIKLELKAMGIDEMILEQQLNELEVDWLDIAQKLRLKKYKQLPQSPEEWQTQARFFQMRGFSPSQIKSVLQARDCPYPDDE